MMDQGMEPSGADIISGPGGSGKLTPTKAAMEPTSLHIALESAHGGAVDVESASRPPESPAREDPALPEPGTPATHVQRDEAAQHLQHVVKLHAGLRTAIATKASGTKVRVSVQSKERDHAALDVEEKEPPIQARRDAARAEGQARVDARTAERVASLRGLLTTQPELQAPPSPRSPANHLGPITRPKVTSN